MAQHRLKCEWEKIKRDPPPLCYGEPTTDEDMFNGKAIIMGPPKSPYEGIALFLKFEANQDDYPFIVPKITFIFPIFHPNVNESGEICILQDQWSPLTSISQLLIWITSILSDPLQDEAPFNLEAARMYENDRENYNQIARNSCQNHFSHPEYQLLYFKFCFWQFGNLRKKLLNYIYEKDTLLQDLCYPNDKLDTNLINFEKVAYNFIPLPVTKLHEKAKGLYPLIKDAEEDIEKWIKVMVESGDIEFVENNIEFRICNDFRNEILWKLYFQFLKKFDTKKLLQLYSLYCRFFPNDTNALEEYKKAVEEYGGPSLIPWKNPFNFEIFDENIKFATAPPRNVQPLTCHFKSDNALPQNLPFKPPFINYIFTQASPKIFQKLHITCKLFFIRYPRAVCYRLEIIDEPRSAKAIRYREASAEITKEFLPQDAGFKNIRISTILNVEKMNDLPLRLSNSLTRIGQCDAKYISISHQNLTPDECKFLIRTKQVIKLELNNVKIFEGNGNGVMLEEILELTPKIRRIKLDDVRCNSRTSQIISELPFENKIHYFRTKNLPNDSLEPYAFAEFVVKNAAPRSGIALRFSQDVNDDYKRNFHEIVKRRVTEVWERGLRPTTSMF